MEKPPPQKRRHRHKERTRRRHNSDTNPKDVATASSASSSRQSIGGATVSSSSEAYPSSSDRLSLPIPLRRDRELRLTRKSSRRQSVTSEPDAQQLQYLQTETKTCELVDRIRSPLSRSNELYHSCHGFSDKKYERGNHVHLPDKYDEILNISYIPPDSEFRKLSSPVYQTVTSKNVVKSKHSRKSSVDSLIDYYHKPPTYIDSRNKRTLKRGHTPCETVSKPPEGYASSPKSASAENVAYLDPSHHRRRRVRSCTSQVSSSASGDRKSSLKSSASSRGRRSTGTSSATQRDESVADSLEHILSPRPAHNATLSELRSHFDKFPENDRMYLETKISMLEIIQDGLQVKLQLQNIKEQFLTLLEGFSYFEDQCSNKLQYFDEPMEFSPKSSKSSEDRPISQGRARVRALYAERRARFQARRIKFANDVESIKVNGVSENRFEDAVNGNPSSATSYETVSRISDNPSGVSTFNPGVRNRLNDDLTNNNLVSANKSSSDSYSNNMSRLHCDSSHGDESSHHKQSLTPITEENSPVVTSSSGSDPSSSALTGTSCQSGEYWINSCEDPRNQFRESKKTNSPESQVSSRSKSDSASSRSGGSGSNRSYHSRERLSSPILTVLTCEKLSLDHSDDQDTYTASDYLLSDTESEVPAVPPRRRDIEGEYVTLANLASPNSSEYSYAPMESFIPNAPNQSIASFGESANQTNMFTGDSMIRGQSLNSFYSCEGGFNAAADMTNGSFFWQDITKHGSPSHKQPYDRETKSEPSPSIKSDKSLTPVKYAKSNVISELYTAKPKASKSLKDISNISRISVYDHRAGQAYSPEAFPFAHYSDHPLHSTLRVLDDNTETDDTLEYRTTDDTFDDSDGQMLDAKTSFSEPSAILHGNKLSVFSPVKALDDTYIESFRERDVRPKVLGAPNHKRPSVSSVISHSQPEGFTRLDSPNGMTRLDSLNVTPNNPIPGYTTPKMKKEPQLCKEHGLHLTFGGPCMFDDSFSLVDEDSDCEIEDVSSSVNTHRNYTDTDCDSSYLSECVDDSHFMTDFSEAENYTATYDSRRAKMKLLRRQTGHTNVKQQRHPIGLSESDFITDTSQKHLSIAATCASLPDLENLSVPSDEDSTLIVDPDKTLTHDTVSIDSRVQDSNQGRSMSQTTEQGRPLSISTVATTDNDSPESNTGMAVPVNSPNVTEDSGGSSSRPTTDNYDYVEVPMPKTAKFVLTGKYNAPTPDRRPPRRKPGPTSTATKAHSTKSSYIHHHSQHTLHHHSQHELHGRSQHELHSRSQKWGSVPFETSYQESRHHHQQSQEQLYSAQSDYLPRRHVESTRHRGAASCDNLSSRNLQHYPRSTDSGVSTQDSVKARSKGLSLPPQHHNVKHHHNGHIELSDATGIRRTVVQHSAVGKNMHGDRKKQLKKKIKKFNNNFYNSNGSVQITTLGHF